MVAVRETEFWLLCKRSVYCVPGYLSHELVVSVVFYLFCLITQPWECGRVRGGFPMLIHMDGSSGIVAFIRDVGRRMMPDKLPDGRAWLAPRDDFVANCATKSLVPALVTMIRIFRL